MKKLLTILWAVTLLAGQTQAETIFGGDFQLYKSGTDPKYSVTAELDDPGPFTSYAQGVGDGVPIAGSGVVNFSDATSGSTADLPGWVSVNGSNPDTGRNGVGGSSGLNIFAGWGSQQRVETDTPVGVLEAGKSYTITAMVDGPSGGPVDGSLAFHLMANGEQLTPTSVVDVALPGGSGFQMISRVYDAAANSDYIGENLTIIIGVEDDNTLSNRMIWDEVTFDEGEGIPVELFELRIALNAENPGRFDFAWDSQDRYYYDLVSSTDLSISPEDWPLWDGRSDIQGTAPLNTIEMVPSGDERRFFAVLRKDARTLLSESFEDDDGGFTFTSIAGTDWTWGTPISSNSGGVPNPGGSVDTGNDGSAKCWGTGIENPGFYANPTTDSCLRSPEFSLVGMTEAKLNFAEAVDVDGGDLAVVKLINAVGDAEIATVYTVTDEVIDSSAWADANEGNAIDLSAGLGETVYLQWCLSGTGGTSQDYIGWYIDDVEVTAK